MALLIANVALFQTLQGRVRVSCLEPMAGPKKRCSLCQVCARHKGYASEPGRCAHQSPGLGRQRLNH